VGGLAGGRAGGGPRGAPAAPPSRARQAPLLALAKQTRRDDAERYAA